MAMDDLSSPSTTPEVEVEVEVRSLGSREGLGAFAGEVESPAAEVGLQEQDLGRGEDRGREDQSGLVKGDGSVFGEVGDGRSGDGGLEELGLEGGENDLPVLRDGSRDEDGVKGKKAPRTEIPDSEADIEEAVSPVQSDVGGAMAQVSGDADGQDADEDGLMAGARGDEDHDVERDGAGGGLEVDSSTALVNEVISPSFENEVLPANALDDDVPTATLNDESTHHEQKAEAKASPANPVLDDSPHPSSNDETSQRLDNAIVSTNAAHQDSDPVSFVDDDSMTVFPQITTLDFQPAHTQAQTQTQTQTQEEDFVGSHFADAIAVMSDAGGGTRDPMSSNDDAGVKNGDISLQSSRELGGGTQPLAESNDVSEQVKLDRDMAKVDGGLDLQLPVSVHSDKAGEVTVEHVSLKQHTVQDASGTGVSPADQEDGTVSTPPEDEDTVMSDETFQHRETEAKDGKVSPVQKAATAGVEIQAGASDPKTTASMTARSIPDSEDDEELPDSEPIVKEVEDSQATLPMISQSASIELAESNERDVDATEAASSKKSTSTFKPPPKTPKTSFKAPSLSTTTESQYTEPTSSPLKPEVTTSTPSKENKEEDKTPPKSFTATDVSQNKDILMAELKAIKIVS